MAGASDKARYYLEQSVPQLQDYARKGIFTRDEITAIAAKRSDFEHILNARGCKAADYARYATYEMNLDALRKKRCKRLGVKDRGTSTAHSGQRTVFFILDRATKKFPGDMALWMQYINFCQQQKANKKLTRVFTSVLRLKPRDWGLWVLAAKHYAENQGDMSLARSYMQRGLRFCKDELKLWLEYVRLEMNYLVRLAARKGALSELGKERSGVDSDRVNENEDVMLLPTITSEDVQPDTTLGNEHVDSDALEKLASTPVFTGAIPIAIFDAATNQFPRNLQAAEHFFELVAHFDGVQATRRIMQHILDYMRETAPDSAEATLGEAKMSLFGVDPHVVEFPAAIGKSLASMKRGFDRLDGTSQAKLAENAVIMLLPYLAAEQELDNDILTVLRSSVRKYLKLMAPDELRRTGSFGRESVTLLVEKLRQNGKESDAVALLELSDPAR